VRNRALVSIGYEGRTVDELVHALQAESVTALVDVRLTPSSRKPGLSKRKLAATLAEVGIAYVHLPALGNPKDNRAAFRAGKPAAYERLRLRFTEDAARAALDEIGDLVDDNTVALLCFERSHEECHRHLVAEAVLAAKPSVRLVVL
jgi:uncharacterized protein (DUF488 family)